MSIKTIDRTVQSNTEGVAKRINKGAEKMVFDILQATQYSTPIPSTVRELATNACDSQREKEIAIEILSGQKTEADYYIRRDGEEYSDSNFDPEYYDLEHLDTKRNDVIIKYHRNEGIGYCDTLEIIDYGVGIGGRRLEGVLELGYSTKRNTSENFGAFGLGAKVALSTGVDYYTVETVHNGKRFKCNCFAYKTDFMIPKFNPHITFSDGTQVHYEETDSKNYTKISFGVKKHNRERFRDSIKDQLSYLGNVKFFIVEDGHEWEDTFQTTVLHNSESLLVSDSYIYSRPHVIIVKEAGASTGINYGYIDFRELEMEQLWGSVGLKCPVRQAIKDPETGEEIVLQEGVEVTPSREKVIWNEATKKFVQGVIENAASEATTLVEDKLKETDFFKWVQACRDVLSKSSYSDDTALKQISKIIDTSKMHPKYEAVAGVKFAGPKKLLRGYSLSSVEETYADKQLSVSSHAVEGWSSVNFKGLYYRDNDVPRNKMKDLYLCELHEGEFTIIKQSNTDKLVEAIKDADGDQKIKLQSQLASISANVLALQPKIEESELINSYEDVEVPQEWLDAFEAKSQEKLLTSDFINLTAAEKRELENRIVAYTVRGNKSTGSTSDFTGHFWDKVEPKLSTVLSSTRTTYYGTKADEAKLKLAATILIPKAAKSANLLKRKANQYWSNPTSYSDFMLYTDEIPTRFFKEFEYVDDYDSTEDSRTQLLRVNEKNAKTIAKNPNCKHIDEFFLQWDDSTKTLSMDNSVIDYLTGKAVGQVPTWISNIKMLNPDFQKLHDHLITYKELYKPHFVSNEESDELRGLMKMLKNMQEFQAFVEQETDEELIAAKSQELFILADVKQVKAVDSETLKLIETKDELIDGVNDFMQAISFPYTPTPEFERELEHYLKSRGKLDIDIQLPQSN